MGLQYYLEKIYDRYEIPLMVVENGSIHDDYRIDYHCAQINAMVNAIDNGIDLLDTLRGVVSISSQQVQVKCVNATDSFM